MNYIGCFIHQLKSGGYKAYIWGQPESHIMDWNGCNYRQRVIPNQPLFGYKTEEEALQAVVNFASDERSIQKWANKQGDGTFLSEEWAAKWTDINFNKESQKWEIHRRKRSYE